MPQTTENNCIAVEKRIIYYINVKSVSFISEKKSSVNFVVGEDSSDSEPETSSLTHAETQTDLEPSLYSPLWRTSPPRSTEESLKIFNSEVKVQ